jgi:hypothetical protein
MTKTQAVALFGGSVGLLARGLGVTTQAISQWPQKLRIEQTDRVTGAAVRLGFLVLVDRNGAARPISSKQ